MMSKLGFILMSLKGGPDRAALQAAVWGERPEPAHERCQGPADVVERVACLYFHTVFLRESSLADSRRFT